MVAFAFNMTALVSVLSKFDDDSTRSPKPRLYWFLLALVGASFTSTLMLLYVETSLMAPTVTFSILTSSVVSSVALFKRETDEPTNPDMD